MTDTTTSQTVPPGDEGCPHWVYMQNGRGAVPMACDLPPDEHETTEAGETVHLVYALKETGVGGEVLDAEKHHEIRWTSEGAA